MYLEGGGYGPQVDSQGRLLDPKKLAESKLVGVPEDIDVFVSKWSKQEMSQASGWVVLPLCRWSAPRATAVRRGM